MAKYKRLIITIIIEKFCKSRTPAANELIGKATSSMTTVVPVFLTALTEGNSHLRIAHSHSHIGIRQD